MGKMNLGKTATSRSRKKAIEQASQPAHVPQNEFTDYLLAKDYSGTTIQRFYDDVKMFQAWLTQQGMEIENVQYSDITAYLQSMNNVSQQTKACYLRGIKHFFNYLIARNERADNPVEFIRLKGVKRKTLYDILNRQELDRLYNSYTLTNEQSKNKNQNWFKSHLLVQKRNKVILGLMLYQALDSRDLKLLTTEHIKLREGKIFIPGTRRSNERELPLESLQIIDMMEYLLTHRKEMLIFTGKQTEALFIPTGRSGRLQNIITHLTKQLQNINPKVAAVKQLKTSVIVHWLRIYNLRQTQYMAGHRYVSSTEAFLVNEMEGMIEDIEKYHPIV